MRYQEIIRETIDWRLPPEPGTTPIPDGHVRLYHQTSETNLGSIKRHGITLHHAQGTEGPRAIYADERGFYGKPGQQPTVEFHVSRDRWDRPFVRGDVEPKDILAIHRPWHGHARSVAKNPQAIADILAGKRDRLLGDPQYGKVISFIKHKYQAREESPLIEGVKRVMVSIDDDDEDAEQKEILVFENPGRAQMKNLIQKYETVRLIVDNNGNLYAWDAYEAQHEDVGNAIGVGIFGIYCFGTVDGIGIPIYTGDQFEHKEQRLRATRGVIGAFGPDAPMYQFG